MENYLSQDRCRALRGGRALPDTADGSALFADIAGFTALTSELTTALGSRRGVEVLAERVNEVYESLIDAVEGCAGSVVGFAGDAITCWFDEEDGRAAARAVAGAHALQARMPAFGDLELKVAVCSGRTRRFVVGDPTVQLLDTLAGATVANLAVAERLARPGDVVVDEATLAAVGGNRFEVVAPGTSTAPTFARLFAPVRRRRSSAGARSDRSTVAVPPVLIAFGQPPTEVAADLEPWLLSAVAEREHAGYGDFLTELRPAVALFLRFSGIDYDHDVHAATRLDVLTRGVQAIVGEHAGALLQLTIGDKGSYLYANFGALEAHEDDARRAAEAALTLHARAEELGFDEPFQIGISSGTMRVGAYGSRSRRTYGALGEPTNYAAALMSAAHPGETWVSEAFRPLLEPLFRLDRRTGAVPKAGSGGVHALLGRRTAVRSSRRASGPTPALFGREAELARIGELLGEAARGRGQTVAVWGEAGLGKSHLLRHAGRLAIERGFSVYVGACEAWGANRAHHAWRPVWQAIFAPDDGADLDKSGVEERFYRLAPHRLAALPLLGPLLELEIPDTTFTRGLAPEDRRNTLNSVLENCLRSLASVRPVCVVLEDWHYADPLTAELLRWLAAGSRTSRVCFLVNLRPGDPGAAPLPPHHAIELGPVAAADATDLLGDLVRRCFPQHQGRISAALAEPLLARAQGNPFFLEELVGHLHQCHPDWPSFELAAAQSGELPDSLHALILSRIDRLSETQKTALRTASVIGRDFRVDWLSGYHPTLGPASRVLTDLDELCHLGFTVPAAAAGERTYDFRHVVTRDVVYDSLPHATRAVLHEQFADFIEPQDAPSHVDLLAFHYDRSGNFAKRLHYLQLAGTAAQASYANDAALDYFGRVLPLLDDAAEQARIEMRRAAVLSIVGRWAEAERALRDALRTADERHDDLARADCLQALGNLCSERGEYVDALAHLTAASSKYAHLDAPAAQAETLRALGTVHFFTGDYDRARADLGAALTLARALDDDRAVANALNMLGVINDVQGKAVDRDACYAECAARREAINDMPGLANIRRTMGVAAAGSGRLDVARRFYEESIALDRAIGNRSGVARTQYNLGLVARDAGDLETARALYEESLESMTELGNRYNASYPMTALAALAFDRGDLDDAHVRYAQCLTLREEMGDRRGVADAHTGLAGVALRRGDLHDAHAAIERSLRLRQQIGDKQVSFDLLGFAAVAAQAQQWRRALALASVAERERWRDRLVWQPLHIALHRETLAAATAALGDDGVARLRADASELTLAAAVELALEPQALTNHARPEHTSST